MKITKVNRATMDSSALKMKGFKLSPRHQRMIAAIIASGKHATEVAVIRAGIEKEAESLGIVV